MAMQSTNNIGESSNMSKRVQQQQGISKGSIMLLPSAYLTEEALHREHVSNAAGSSLGFGTELLTLFKTAPWETTSKGHTLVSFSTFPS